MKKVGDYEWRQVSAWCIAPKNCIIKNVFVDSGRCFTFYLERIKEVEMSTPDISRYKIETVAKPDGVPDDVLNWRNRDYTVRGDGKEVKK